ncbi:hypothetical protein VPHPS32B4_0050 [Vibrio phage PS32B-4]
MLELLSGEHLFWGCTLVALASFLYAIYEAHR